MWKSIFRRKEFDGVCNSDASCVGDGASVATIMFESWSDIISVEAMGGPCTTLGRSLIYDDFGARWSHGSAVEIKDAFKLVPGRQFWIEVDGDFGCGSSSSHCWSGKSLSVEHKMEMKCSLKVRIARSAELRR